MTSKPASRNELAITFAPRSCPSRPGFATRTRILRSVIVLPLCVRRFGAGRLWPGCQPRNDNGRTRNHPQNRLQRSVDTVAALASPRHHDQAFVPVRERPAVPATVVANLLETRVPQQRIDFGSGAQAERVRLAAALRATPPAEPLVAHAGNGIEAASHAHFGTVGQRPLIALGVRADDVIAVHGLEQQPAAGTEYAPRFAQRREIVG